MSNLIFILLVLAAFAVTIGAFIWAVRWLYFGFKAQQFIKEADDRHHLVYTIKTVSGRGQARRDFEALVDEAVRSKNGYINNRDTAETLLGYVEFAVQMAVADEQPDAEAATSWGEGVKEKLQPMLSKPRINEKRRKALAE
ncbi:MAG TPA: hypothetical protein VGB98_26350 [Pyrinomonadaceae bacterium]|jgi:hypothetical protein